MPPRPTPGSPREVLEVDATHGGAHYGLAFLLLRRGDRESAARHLRAFLGHPPRGPDAPGTSIAAG